MGHLRFLSKETPASPMPRAGWACPPGRVERLLEEEVDRRTLTQFQQSYIENAPLCRRERTYPGRALDAISVEHAGRLARAMGYAPCEIEGC